MCVFWGARQGARRGPCACKIAASERQRALALLVHHEADGVLRCLLHKSQPDACGVRGGTRYAWMRFGAWRCATSNSRCLAWQQGK